MEARIDLPAVSLNHRRRASQLLLDLAAMPGGEMISVREIVAAFGERAFGPVLIVLGLMNCVPAPPGLISIVGVPLLLVAIQMVIGRPTPWLPQFILRREFKRSEFARFVQRAQPTLNRIERLCRPRMPGIFNFLPEYLLGVLICLCAVSVMVPLPLTNFFPSLAVVVMAVALLEADGVLLAVGIVMGIMAVTATAVITAAVFGLVNQGLDTLF